jgi:serine protease inhibitor ecotin
MKLHVSLIVTAFLLVFSCKAVHAEATESAKKYADYDLNMYPKNNDSIKRYVIEVPPKENEGFYSIEICAAQTNLEDCNKHIIMGTFTQKKIKD